MEMKSKFYLPTILLINYMMEENLFVTSLNAKVPLIKKSVN